MVFRATCAGTAAVALAALAGFGGCQAGSFAGRLVETDAPGPWRVPEAELADRMLDDVGYAARGLGRGEVPLSDAPLHRRLHVLLGLPAEWLEHTRRAEQRMAGPTASSAESIGKPAVETPGAHRRRVLLQLANKDPATRAAGLFALTPEMLAVAEPVLAGLLADPEPTVRAEAAAAARRLGAATLAPRIADRLASEPDPLVQSTLLEALAELDPLTAARAARDQADRAVSPLVRAQAIELVARLPGDDRASRLVDRLERDASFLVKDTAAQLLERLTGRALPAPSSLGRAFDPDVLDALRAWDRRGGAD